MAIIHPTPPPFGSKLPPAIGNMTPQEVQHLMHVFNWTYQQLDALYDSFGSNALYILQYSTQYSNTLSAVADLLTQIQNIIQSGSAEKAGNNCIGKIWQDLYSIGQAPTNFVAWLQQQNYPGFNPNDQSTWPPGAAAVYANLSSYVTNLTAELNNQFFGGSMVQALTTPYSSTGGLGISLMENMDAWASQYNGNDQPALQLYTDWQNNFGNINSSATTAQQTQGAETAKIQGLIQALLKGMSQTQQKAFKVIMQIMQAIQAG